MEVLHERCAGMDVHRDTVVACAITPEGREVRTFGAVTDGLLLVDVRVIPWPGVHGIPRWAPW